MAVSVCLLVIRCVVYVCCCSSVSCRLSFLFPGVFGQPDPWDIYNSATYQHPMVPYDVLIDPLSLPLHPLMQERPVGTEEVLFGKASANGLMTMNGKELEVNPVLQLFCSLFICLYTMACLQPPQRPTCT